MVTKLQILVDSRPGGSNTKFDEPQLRDLQHAQQDALGHKALEAGTHFLTMRQYLPLWIEERYFRAQTLVIRQELENKTKEVGNGGQSSYEAKSHV